MNGSERFIIQDNSQASRIVTYPLLDQHPPAFRVSWIHWDSSFRKSGLRVGDQIIAVNGAEDFVSAMASKGIAAKFREWHADARRALERDFEEIFRRMEERLRDQPEELQKEIKNYVAAFKDQLNRNVKEWIDKIDKTIQEAEKTYAIDKVRTNYEPKEPLDALRGK